MRTSQAANPQSACIAIIDDDPVAHEMFEAYLKADSYRIVHATDAGEALAMLASESIDVVICDLMMPGIDGLELCHRIKGHPSWRLIPVALVTALDGDDDLVRGLEAGADEFLTKPVSRLVLRARVRVLARIRRQYLELGQVAVSLEDLLRARVNALSQDSALSAREREVLDLLMIGRTTKDVARALGISPRTVKFHRRNIFEKLGAESVLDLLRLML